MSQYELDENALENVLNSELKALDYEIERIKHNILVKKVVAKFDNIHCIDCGDPIEPERLKLIDTVYCSFCTNYH